MHLRVSSRLKLLFAVLTFIEFGFAKRVTIFDDFCEDEQLYKPYIKYYHGRLDAVRQGKPFKVHPPGFRNDIWGKLENTYVCINGPAWLYYQVTTSTSEVYEQPELHMFIHQCVMINPKKGPGGLGTGITPKEDVELMAILLMGDSTDYRLPAIQLFTAPYQKDPACVPQPEVICDPPVAGCTPTAAVICPGMVNTTSLMMFGDETECILTKGKGKVKAPVRIRTVPVPATVTSDPPTAGTFCRLSYREIKDQLDFGTPAPPDTAPLILEVQDALTNDKPIKLQGCYLPENFTKRTVAIINARVNGQAKLNPDDKDAELNLENYYAKINKIDPIPPDVHLPKALPTEAPFADQASFMTAVSAKQKEIDDALVASPTADVTAMKTELITIKLRNYIINAFQEHEDYVKTYKETETAWKDTLKPLADKMETEELQISLDKQKEKDEAFKKDQKDPILEAEYKTKLQEYNTALQTLKYKTNNEFQPVVSKAEILATKLDNSKQTTILALQAHRRAYDTAKSGGTPKLVKITRTEPTELKPPVPVLLTIKRTPIPVPPDKDDLITTCGDLPKSHATCASVKPNADRACKLLDARLNKNPLEWKPEDAWRQEVLDLLADIFYSASSPILKREFPVLVNRILRLYLIDPEALVVTPVPITRSSSPPVAVANAEPVNLPPIANDPEPKLEEDDIPTGRDILSHDVPPTTLPPPTTKPPPTIVPPGPAIDRGPKPPLEPDRRRRTAKAVIGRRRKRRDAVDPAISNTTDASTDPISPAAADPSGSPVSDPSGSSAALLTTAAPVAATDPSPETATSASTGVTDLPPVAVPKLPANTSVVDSGSKTIGSVDPRLTTVFKGGSTSVKSSGPTLRAITTTLPERRPFWAVIIQALNYCKKREFQLEFRRVNNEGKEEIWYTKVYPNGTQEDLQIEHFIEQADDEFAFNFVIDSNWRIFATVMGICMPDYEKKVPLITSMFYSHYTEDFLVPLQKEWINPRDNYVFKYILGEYYNGKGLIWSKLSMEASYLQGESCDVKYRPLRKLLVNDFNEPNFFTSGPLAGTAGMYPRTR